MVPWKYGWMLDGRSIYIYKVVIGYEWLSLVEKGPFHT